MQLFKSFDELKESPVYELVKDAPLTKSGFFNWVHRDFVVKNDYNPNAVADPEMELLKLSIIEDGWTQPIVGISLETRPNVLIIVDGYHRWFTSGTDEVLKRYNGYLPCTILHGKNRSDLIIATIRHNRARGTHHVLRMAENVKELLTEGMAFDVIMKRLQMEKEEVKRLALSVGISQMDEIKIHEFSKAYIPKNTLS